MTAVAQAPQQAQQAPRNTAGKTFFSVQELFHEENKDTVPTTTIPTLQEAEPTGLARPTSMAHETFVFADTWVWEGYMKSLDAVGLLGKEQYIVKNVDNTHFVLLEELPGDTQEYIRSK